MKIFLASIIVRIFGLTNFVNISGILKKAASSKPTDRFDFQWCRIKILPYKNTNLIIE